MVDEPEHTASTPPAPPEALGAGGPVLLDRGDDRRDPYVMTAGTSGHKGEPGGPSGRHGPGTPDGVHRGR